MRNRLSDRNLTDCLLTECSYRRVGVIQSTSVFPLKLTKLARLLIKVARVRLFPTPDAGSAHNNGATQRPQA